MAILDIGQSSSRCQSCRRGADLSETGHFTVLGYGVKEGEVGCGEPWTMLTGLIWAKPQQMRDHLANCYGEHLRHIPYQGEEEDGSLLWFRS